MGMNSAIDSPMGAIKEDNREDFDDDLQPITNSVDKEQQEIGSMDYDAFI